jgi:hypothetical protein
MGTVLLSCADMRSQLEKRNPPHCGTVADLGMHAAAEIPHAIFSSHGQSNRSLMLAGTSVP